MKIAVLSDVHGNLPALEAVAEDIAVWQPDFVFVNGDTVNRGPRSAETFDFVTAQPTWQLLRGNHEGYLGDFLGDDPEFFALPHWTFHQIGRNRTETCMSWPDGHSHYVAEGVELRLRHASMIGNRDSIFEDSSEEKLETQISPAPALFCTSHTHRPFVRKVGDAIIVNTGSAGTTFDSDRRASYARIIWHAHQWHITIPRIAYDTIQAEQDYFDTGYFEGVGMFGHLVFHEWRQATPIIPRWFKRYGDAMASKQIDRETAIRQFLREEALE